MNPTFGARLRLQRERREIALATIAEQTKIKLSLLEALERDDLSHWPLGIFGRSYIRSYAQAIGLDPAATVREFIERHPGSVEAPATELTEVHALTPEKASRRPPTRLGILIDSAIDKIQARRAEHGSDRPIQPAGRTCSGNRVLESVAPRRGRRLPGPEPLPLDPKPLSSLDLLTVAQLCTRLGAQEASETTASRTRPWFSTRSV
jgi:hypothetical protein